MPVTLHHAVVQTYQQILPQIAGLIDKAEGHCADNSLDAGTLTEAYLARDMWPFAKQVFECGHHSARAIEGVRAGVFGPEIDPVPSDFAALRKEIADARAIVDGVEPGELEEIADRDMLFKFGEREIPFTVTDFLLSFSLPNFYFHATSAYAVLRNQGLPVGKMDYLGKLRTRA
ncbi:MAG: DUF1993 domain-containing protein [Sphingomonadaceae bacterium]|jgi:hypothetical protein